MIQIGRIVFLLIMLHGPHGREIDIAVDEITSLQCKLPNVPNKLFTEGANAIVNMTDGKFVSVAETCMVIRDLIEQAQKQRERSLH